MGAVIRVIQLPDVIGPSATRGNETLLVGPFRSNRESIIDV
jgi:hypothetical protein